MDVRRVGPSGVTASGGSNRLAEQYTMNMFDELRRGLEHDSRVVYALVFGSAARGAAHAHQRH